MRLKVWQLWVLAILAVACVGVWMLAIHQFTYQSKQMNEAFDAMTDYCLERNDYDCYGYALDLYMSDSPALLDCWQTDNFSLCEG
jgi:uncharacterized membrane protein